MGIFERVKLWWKSKTPVEKVLTVLGGITCAGITVGAVCEVKKRCSVEEPVAALPETATDDSVKEEFTPGKTEYEMSAELLRTLWRTDDLLFPENWELAESQVDDMMIYMAHPAHRIKEILDRADDEDLGQDDLFEVQAEAEDLTRYLAEREGRTEEFEKSFPWLNYVPADEKKEAKA